MMSSNLHIQTYADAQAFLFSRFDLERTMNSSSPDTFKLDRMRQLAELLGNPQSKLSCIHIAGTKGKGSVSSMVSQILTDAGYSTGLFISPHLEHLRQRFCINNAPCSEEDFLRIIQQIVPAVEEMDRRDGEQPEFDLKPTFFEITTLFAFLYFHQANVNVAVVEVGLGGRLDSTNICEPIVTAITNIGLDHTKILGDTLELIAREKAGIIKPEVPVVSGCTVDAPMQEIETIAKHQHAPVLRLGRDIVVSAADDPAIHPNLKHVSIQGEVMWSDLNIGIPGQHQITNAAVCLGLIYELRKQGFTIPDEAVRSGLANVTCPGRLELIETSPRILLDVSHNPGSATALTHFLRQNFSGTRMHLILSCSRDKQYNEIVKLLAPEFHSITLTRFQKNPRAVEPEELYQHAVTACNNLAPRKEIVENPQDALKSALDNAKAEDLIVITGSFYLIAELRPLVIQKADQHREQ